MRFYITSRTMFFRANGHESKSASMRIQIIEDVADEFAARKIWESREGERERVNKISWKTSKRRVEEQRIFRIIGKLHSPSKLFDATWISIKNASPIARKCRFRYIF